MTAGACSCDAGGEDIACPTHGAEATIRELQAENTRLREALDAIVDDLSVPSRPAAWAASALKTAQDALTGGPTHRTDEETRHDDH